MSKGWFNNIARLVKKKNGGYCIFFERAKNKDGEYIGESPYPLIINEGDVLQARRKMDDLQGLIDSGRISQDTADKICEVVKFEISKAPDKDEPPAKPATGKKSANPKGGVDF